MVVDGEFSYNIRELKSSDSIDYLTELLHRAYKQLADMGLRYHATFQSSDITAKRIKNGVCFVVEYDNKIIATLTYYPPKHSFAGNEIGLTDTGWLSQMGVEPELQKKGIGLSLIKHAENYAKKSGVNRMGMDTSEKAEHLIRWYKKLGYQYHSHVNWEITNYRSVVLLKEL